MEKCKKCLAPESSTWENDFIKKNGICEKCYLENKDLIKHDDHYVLWEYQNYCDIEGDVSLDPKDFEDANTIPPTISWCTKHEKWKLEFTGTESDSGFAVDLVWYFDSKKDIIKRMEK